MVKDNDRLRGVLEKGQQIPNLQRLQGIRREQNVGREQGGATVPTLQRLTPKPGNSKGPSGNDNNRS